MRAESIMLLLAAAGLGVWYYAQHHTASTGSGTVSGGNCPGSPGCPGYVAPPVTGGDCPGSPWCPGYVAPEGVAGLGNVWRV